MCSVSRCVAIPIIEGDVSYCNITTVWQARVTSPAAYIVPPIIPAILGLLMLQYNKDIFDDFLKEL